MLIGGPRGIPGQRLECLDSTTVRRRTISRRCSSLPHQLVEILEPCRAAGRPRRQLHLCVFVQPSMGRPVVDMRVLVLQPPAMLT